MKNRIVVYSRYVLLFALVVFSVLACVKGIFFGLNIDEEYAVTMAYRIVGQDSLFRTMWEPHQTSGFVCAFLIKVFLTLTGGSTDYMIIYLRIMGIVIHAGVCFYLYVGLRRICSGYYALLLSIVCFAVLPKWILVAEFSNMLLWVVLCMMSCFLQIQYAQSVKAGSFIILGILTAVGVLAYPSFLICFLVYCVAIYNIVSERRVFSLGIYVFACVGVGLLYIAFFASKLGIGTFVDGIINMATDGQHETPLIEKLLSNGLELLKCSGIYVVIYLIVYTILRILKRDIKKGLFAALPLISVLWQFGVWLSDSRYFNEPLILFYHIFITVIMLGKWERKELWCYVVPPVAACFAAGILTNTGIYVISVFLLPAIVYGLARWEGKDRLGGCIVIVSLAVLFLFAKGWLVCENEGYKADMTYVKQKALSGPAKNIYCRYMDGYEYNIVQELMDAYVEDGDKVLCVSTHSIWYLLGDVEIANYSTISTPTYDERLLAYYDNFPEKYPDVIILQEGPEKEKIIEMFHLTDPVVEREGVCIYRP